MNTREIISEIFDAQEFAAENYPIQGIYDSLDSMGKKPGSWKERKKGRKGIVLPPTQAALNESYMPKKVPFGAGDVSRDCTELWGIARDILKGQLTAPAFGTWVAPVKAIGYRDQALVLAVSDDFAREQLLKRYRTQLQSLLSELTDGSITKIDVQVDKAITPNIAQPQPGLKPAPLGIDRRNQWGMVQNPTNNPRVDELLRHFGDMRTVFNKHPMFKIPLAPINQGGWNITFPALMTLGNQYGLERCVEAVESVKHMLKARRDITNPGGLFRHAVMNGLRAETHE